MPSQYRQLREAIIPIGPSIAYIPLTQGKFALVDSWNALWLARRLWCAMFTPQTAHGFYAGRMNRHGDEYGTRMHCAILRVPVGVTVDHKNGNGLDNRECNLRPASQRQQSMNTGLYKNNRSGYKGVRAPSGKILKHIARIRVDGRLVYLGYIADPMEAARLYDKAAKYFFGEFARLDFPDEDVPQPTESEIAKWLQK